MASKRAYSQWPGGCQPGVSSDTGLTGGWAGLVQSALRTVLAGRTALIIAHRLSTVAIADRVLVLRSGRVIEDGTPAELMGGAGEYADLHARWAASLA
jgi:ABC-type multidrug transport system ATPase subunit